MEDFPGLIVILPVLMLGAALLSLPPWLVAKRRGTWFSWDYTLPVVPATLWLFLAGAGVGPQSLSNLVELLAVLAVVPLAVWVRVFALDRAWKNQQLNSVACFVCCLALPVVLRVSMPLLPE